MTTLPIAVLFPGQGAQAHGMGRKLAEMYAPAMNLWKRGEKISGLPLRAIYWESEDEMQMAETNYLQPAITIVNLSLWEYAKSRLAPAATAGHSLGEFSCLGAAGVLPIDVILELVTIRGKLMSQADPDHIGTMYAVLRLSLTEVEDIAKRISDSTGKMVRVANHNTPGQFVVSGHRAAMEEVLEEVRQAKGKAMPMAVNGAFHSPLMAEASAEFSKLLDKQDWHNPAFPIYCNISGEALNSSDKVHAAVRKQMTSSVLWIDVITNLYRSGIRRFFEFGPKGVLTRMIRPILSTGNIPEASYEAEYISHPPDLENLLADKS